MAGEREKEKGEREMVVEREKEKGERNGGRKRRDRES